MILQKGEQIERESKRFLTTLSAGVKSLDFSCSSDDLTVGFASSLAGKVSGPAGESGVDLAVELASVVFSEDSGILQLSG